MPSYVTPSSTDTRSHVLQELEAVRLKGTEHHLPLVERLRRIVPFDDFSFTGLDLEGCDVGQGIYLASSLPQGFTRAYTEKKFVEIDPLVSLISPQRPLGSWEEAIDRHGRDDTRSQHIFQALRKFDVGPRTGVALWNKGRMYGSAIFTRAKPFTDDELMMLEMFTPSLHASLAKPVIMAVNRRLRLSRGEILCLELAAAGLTSEEIAADSPNTYETVTTYLKAATRKLKASNRSHAIAEALRRRIIQ